MDKAESDHIDKTRNLSRYFVESPQVGWLLLICTLIWGVFSYDSMEKRKDPLYSNVFCCAVCQWPGASAVDVEQLVTRKIEEKVSENTKVRKIQSVSRSNISICTIQLSDDVKKPEQEFDDLKLRLDGIRDLPDGAGPVIFMKDYGEIPALMLSIASPKANAVEISLRARAIKESIEHVRAGGSTDSSSAGGSDSSGKGRTSIVVCYPQSLPAKVPQRQRDLFIPYAESKGIFKDIRRINGNGFVGLDGICTLTDAELDKVMQAFVDDRLQISHQHPDLWEPAVIHSPDETEAKLKLIAGDKYSYAEMDRFTDLIKRTLQSVPEVTRINRIGILPEQINLDYSEERLASYGFVPADVKNKLQQRNIAGAAGLVELGGKNLPIRATGRFSSEQEIGSTLISTANGRNPVYLRDIVDINRSYESPPHFLCFMNSRNEKGEWQRTRSIVMSVFMRQEAHIDEFGEAVDKSLEELRPHLPEDLIIARTSDQPKQVEDNVELFMNSLYEAVVLVIITALVGFWEWRQALLIALSIPATLTMTFGMMALLGIDLQQVSIASLIISLGLLVDDPVVAGDAIKTAMEEGHDRKTAAWLGPTKLAHAIMFATLTNIAAYLPLLLLPGTIGQFIYALPVVITCSLIASRIVTMTFVPMLGYYLLRPPKPGKEPSAFAVAAKERYYAIANWLLDKRIIVLTGVIVVLVLGYLSMGSIKTQFFPNDQVQLCWVDVWLPEDAPLKSTNEAAASAENVIREVCAQYAQEHKDKDGKPEEVLDSICTFVGGGGPRFWHTILPELDQLNYAQVVIKLKDKHVTAVLLPRLQKALNASTSRATLDTRALESGEPVGVPVAIRISGSDPGKLRTLAAKVAQIFQACPISARVRDDWGAQTFTVKLKIDNDKANLAGLTNSDIANASIVGMNGDRVDALNEGDKQIPIVVRLRAEESSNLNDLSQLYVYSQNSQQKVPLKTVASLGVEMEPEKIRRRNQFRTITISCFPKQDYLPSEVMTQVKPELDKLAASLPPGYKLEVGGEDEEQWKSFKQMAMVMAVSVISIFLCLVVQFNNVVKPMIVFAGIPFGILGALLALTIMGQPFGFPAFMGVASLTGVIVSHVIVLFDFIEHNREHGEPMRQALVEASLARWRPVLITVSATVLGLFPLAAHGGPLWQPLCYAQIGGLVLATINTLLLVPLLYAVCVLDLKIVKWEK